MTEPERQAALAVAGCRLRPATWDKRYCRDMAARARQDPGYVLSEAQREQLWRCVFRYRRQLFRDGARMTAEQVRGHFVRRYGEMNEAGWLAEADPARLLEYLGGRWIDGKPRPAYISDRKLRLVACACCRAVWHLLADPRSRAAVEVAERYADGGATQEELWAALQAASDALDAADYGSGPSEEFRLRHLAQTVCRDDVGEMLEGFHAGRRNPVVRDAVQAALLRDIVGNPFRPVVLPLARHERYYADGTTTSTPILSSECPWLAWSDGAVRRLAEAIYESRDFSALPVLADALEEAGASDPDLLSHLRGPGPHTRGCWAVDLLTGRA